MRRPALLVRAAFVLLMAVSFVSTTIAGELPAAVKEQLASSTYVYIASQRKGGGFGKPAEIWFLYHEGAVWVGTAPTSWRARRIKAGRTAAQITVGKPDGPSFRATGATVDNPQIQELMLQTYAKKYPDRWPGYEQKFRTGFKDGSRVLIRYAPQ
jgi:hypothetical protein